MEVVSAAVVAITSGPRKSAHCLAQEIAGKACHHDDMMFLYRMYLSQPLSENGKVI
jgi:hypothetical protein